jgi:hypothetical protein
MDLEKRKYRVLVFLWYLNDVYEGSETDIFGGDILVKPEKGKLLLFPAQWCFPHCGRIPLSDDKILLLDGYINIFRFTGFQELF